MRDYVKFCLDANEHEVTAFSVYGNFVYGSKFVSRPVNQVSKKVLNGTRVTFTNGIKFTDCTLLINNVIPSEFQSLNTFITTTCDFQLKEFRMIPSTWVDVGLGQGVKAINLAWSTPEFSYEHIAPGVYNLILKYEMRAYS